MGTSGSQSAVSPSGLIVSWQRTPTNNNDTAEPPQNHPPGFPLAIVASITPDFSGSDGGESSEMRYANSPPILTGERRLIPITHEHVPHCHDNHYPQPELTRGGILCRVS